MKQLSESDIVRIMREEYASKLRVLAEAIDISLVSPGLKVRDKTTADGERNQFTVERCGSWGVELSWVTPEGETKFKRVDKDDFERDYDTPAEVRKEKKQSSDGGSDE